jgi:dynein heavy chain
MYTYFVERCKKKLHIVLCFSPIGEAFRTRIRMFPSLVNCTTIDWFQEWPADALQNVASYFLSKMELEKKDEENCSMLCQYFHRQTIKWSGDMLA